MRAIFFAMVLAVSALMVCGSGQAADPTSSMTSFDLLPLSPCFGRPSPPEAARGG